MKAMYKVIDAKGRIVIPKELREKLHISDGDIVEVKLYKEFIKIEKLDIIQLHDDSIEALINIMISMSKKNKKNKKTKIMDKKSLLYIMRRLFELIEYEEEDNESFDKR